MAKYQIWDEVSRVIVPTGKVYTAEQWMQKYPMAREEDIKLVIAGGKINGAFCMEYESFKDTYEKQGCDFSACETEQDYLDAIEAFEDEMNTPSTEPTAEERIASALEAQVMLSLPDAEETETTETETTETETTTE